MSHSVLPNLFTLRTQQERTAYSAWLSRAERRPIASVVLDASVKPDTITIARALLAAAAPATIVHHIQLHGLPHV